MKRFLQMSIVFIVMITAADAGFAQTLFKQKKYFGPIPFNTVSLSIGFIDGPSAELLAADLDHWALTEGRAGYDDFELISTSPFARVGYQRQLTPNHFLRTSFCFSYLKTSSLGFYHAINDPPPFGIDIKRTLKIYLLSLEIGFAYYLISPEVRHISPYVGGGFAAIFPLVRLDNESFLSDDGSPFPNPGENVSRNSLEAGIHGEFGMTYYITNRYSAGIEGRYQMAQSKFYTHKGNSDIDYAGFSLSMNLYHHF